MATILVTGAGRGLGAEFARQFAADGWRVIATVRDLQAGAKLAALGPAVEVHQLDVRDGAAIARLGQELEGQAIDVLLSNAGLYGPEDGGSFAACDHRTWHEVMEVNVMAPLALARAFVGQVAASKRKAMVMVTSRMGSIDDNTGGGAYIYRSSKAALNMVAKSLSVDLRPRGIAVIVVHPGWVRTDMGGASAPLSPKESIGGLKRLIEGLSLQQSGGFFNYDGTPLPW